MCSLLYVECHLLWIISHIPGEDTEKIFMCQAVSSDSETGREGERVGRGLEHSMFNVLYQTVSDVMADVSG